MGTIPDRRRETSFKQILFIDCFPTTLLLQPEQDLKWHPHATSYLYTKLFNPRLALNETYINLNLDHTMTSFYVLKL